MRSLALSLVSAALLPLSSFAATADFSDLTTGASLTPGATFSSAGIRFTVVGFPGVGSQVLVRNASGAGSGITPELFLGNSIGLGFHLPPATNEVSLLFGVFSGSKTALRVNDVLSPTSLGFASLDGLTFGGVKIFVETFTIRGGIRGRLTLRGPISSLVAAGPNLPSMMSV
jgi:hypothetical protein